MTSSAVAIRIRGVSHQFGEEGDARYVRALRDASLDIVRGELLCLIGPSGCGKSTLLNVIGGLMAPTAGAVDVAGKRVAGPMPRDIAFVFQENALFPWNTVFENVNLGMVFQGVPRAECVEMNSSCTSARTAIGSRASGSPQPPPPPVRTITSVRTGTV